MGVSSWAMVLSCACALGRCGPARLGMVAPAVFALLWPAAAAQASRSVACNCDDAAGRSVRYRGNRRSSEERERHVGMSEPQVPRELETLLRGAYAAFNARDVDAVIAVLHPDVDW